MVKLRTIMPDDWHSSKQVRDEVRMLCYQAEVAASSVTKIEVDDEGGRAWLEVVKEIEIRGKPRQVKH